MLNKIFPNGIECDETATKLLEWRLSNIEEWITLAISGQIYHCREEFIKEWIPRLQNDPSVESIPARIEDLVKMVTERPDYRNRQQRDAERKAKNESNFTVQ